MTEIAGQVTVVNFWATCGTPCREEIPDFVKLQAEFGGRGVRFVGIAAERAEKIPAFVREFGINYPILVGDVAAIELSRKLGDKAGALPFTVVLDRDRRLVHRELGILKPAKLREILTRLL
jgi:thiol-disulfide isomerase/thioredoxin